MIDMNFIIYNDTFCIYSCLPQSSQLLEMNAVVGSCFPSGRGGTS